MYARPGDRAVVGHHPFLWGRPMVKDEKLVSEAYGIFSNQNIYVQILMGLSTAYSIFIFFLIFEKCPSKGVHLDAW